MRKSLFVVSFLLFSMLGGAIGQAVGFSNVALGAYQMLSVWTGAAGGGIPSWVNGYYGFSGAETSNINVTPFFSVSPSGRWGGIFATRSSDNIGTGYPSGLNELCVQDNPSTASGIWCQYIQAIQVAGAKNGGQLFGMENSGWNEKAPVTNLDPFNVNVGNSLINERLDCGIGPGHTSGLTNCTTAINIINNQFAYSSPAIVIGNGVQDTTSTQNPTTIAVPVNYSYSGYVSSGVIGFQFFGGAGSPVGAVSCTSRCLYIRTDGGTGSTLYINETGGGTSGWAAK